MMRWPWQRRVDPAVRDRLGELVDQLRRQNSEACQLVEEMRRTAGGEEQSGDGHG